MIFQQINTKFMENATMKILNALKLPTLQLWK